MYSTDEVEAAMCIWEECINRRLEKDDKLFDWLRGGEGVASARDMCIQLCGDLEESYLLAREWFGFDDSFDWEFVPRWCSYVMELTEEHDLVAPWHKYIAYKVTCEWKEMW
jgi:hypothetical protein